MEWHSIILSNQEVVAGKQGIIQDAFTTILIAAASPSDATLYCSEFDDKGRITLYFSPKASEIASMLIMKNGGVPCSPPDKSVIFKVVSVNYGTHNA